MFSLLPDSRRLKVDLQCVNSRRLKVELLCVNSRRLKVELQCVNSRRLKVELQCVNSRRLKVELQCEGNDLFAHLITTQRCFLTQYMMLSALLPDRRHGKGCVRTSITRPLII